MPASRGESGAQALLRGMIATVAGSVQDSMHDGCRPVWHAAASELLRREVVRKWELCWSRLPRSRVGYWPRDGYQE
jgi:hypothetical protein